jgi:ferrous iron transport protein B
MPLPFPARTVAIPSPLLRGARRPRVALVGRHQAGKDAIFRAASSTRIKCGVLAGSDAVYEESVVEVGLEQASLIRLPDIHSLHDTDATSQALLKYLLWGDQWPDVASHEDGQPTSAFAPPDVLLQVVDATMLATNLELTLELSQLGRPLVIALNRLDEVRARGIYINTRALSEQLGIPVIPTVAHMGKGVPQLFEAVMTSAHGHTCPLPQTVSPHLRTSLRPMNELLTAPEIEAAFHVPRPFLLLQLAEQNDYFSREMASHFPALTPALESARTAAEATLPRPLAEELHADRHHQSARLYEKVTQISNNGRHQRWKRLLDRCFLHPQWGLFGTLAVFALVLYMVFEVSATLDSISSAPLAAWAAEWVPTSTTGVVAHAVVDALIGLVGIVVPYMLPLVMLLVALEESGIMHRVAFVVDRGFHHLGLHGGVAVPFLLGLGCNVPAISAAVAASQGRERIVAAILITFVPCSARSAIILAIGGKYLGGLGVFALFLLTLFIIALAGKLLTRRYTAAGPGLIQEIPSYALPHWKTLLATTWERTSDIITIVTPLLVGGSIVLALLTHFGADRLVNTALHPVTVWLLGLPVVLGVPILFGVLRKELSLLMVYQALGSQDIATVLSQVQIATFLVFLTFYVPCLSTFAVMLKNLGRREALFSVGLSIAIALGISVLARLLMGVIAWVV